MFLSDENSAHAVGVHVSRDSNSISEVLEEVEESVPDEALITEIRVSVLHHRYDEKEIYHYLV